MLLVSATVETPGSRSGPAVRGYAGRGTVHTASLQDVLDATLVAVSAQPGCCEEGEYCRRWSHEVCTEGDKLTREVALLVGAGGGSPTVTVLGSVCQKERVQYRRI